MHDQILIVEDEFIVANQLKLIITKAGYEVCGIASSVKKAMELVGNKSPQLVLLDIYLKGPLTGIDLAHELNERNIPFIYLSANSNQSVLEEAKKTQPYGFMIKPFRDDEVIIAIEIAKYRHKHGRSAEAQKVTNLQATLTEISRSGIKGTAAFLELAKEMQSYVPFDFLEMGRKVANENKTVSYKFLRIGYKEYQLINGEGFQTITGKSSQELSQIYKDTPYDARAGFSNEKDFEGVCRTSSLKHLYSSHFGVQSYLAMPMLIDYGTPFVFSFYSKSSIAYSAKHIQFLVRVQQFLGTLIRTIVDDSATRSLASSDVEKTSEEKNPFPGILGKSQPMLTVLDYVKQVAIVDTSILILGETGTGKEQVANHIHRLSSRSIGPLIKVNCAALPIALIESELFGHEKGAFTGADNKKEGRFEQANNGTLFLDEIGDMPLDVQVKLLRVLQEREIQRIGSNTSIPLDVRVIAATNKNLEREIAAGRFRLDLYYRLNVFPITIPPLRDRKEDIPLLARHFTHMFANKHQKQITSISSGAITQLMQYDWPGNVRELENSLERSVILCSSNTLNNVYIQMSASSMLRQNTTAAVKSIEEVEKEHIKQVLIRCNHKISGSGGAAEMLGIPSSTLSAKIKRFGLMRET